MKVDVEPTLFAVGALIVCGNEFAVVTEKNTSRKSVKLAGQETYPMETIEDFDPDDLATLQRACKEEVNLSISHGKIVFLNTIQTRPGVALRNYLIKIPSKELVGSGSFVHEISPVRWLPLEEVLQSKGSLRFRPGVHETVSDYFHHASNSAEFKPANYLYTELVDQIPVHIFELVEAGLARSEAVSQYSHHSQL